jgi:transcriptional regulator with XRE-family HTH domain
MSKKTSIDDSLGQRWLKARKGLGLTQAQLAEKLEVSAPYLSLIENGKRPCPGIAVIRRLHQLSKKSIEFLAGGDL